MTVSPAQQNGGSRLAGAQEKLRDHYIDRQYKKPTSTVEQYAEEPWKHCQDTTNTFLSLRFDDQWDFLRSLKVDQQERIGAELDRIAAARKQFSSYPNKKVLMKQLQESKGASQSASIPSMTPFSYTK